MMNDPFARIEHVSESLVEPLKPLASEELRGDSFGVAIPLALLAALGWLGAAILRRRRRDAALF